MAEAIYLPIIIGIGAGSLIYNVYCNNEETIKNNLWEFRGLRGFSYSTAQTEEKESTPQRWINLVRFISERAPSCSRPKIFSGLNGTSLSIPSEPFILTVGNSFHSRARFWVHILFDDHNNPIKVNIWTYPTDWYDFGIWDSEGAFAAGKETFASIINGSYSEQGV